MLDSILCVIVLGLIGLSLWVVLGLLLLPVYVWLRWHDAMTDIDAKHR
jgi:hypothetical protein